MGCAYIEWNCFVRSEHKYVMGNATVCINIAVDFIVNYV